MYRYINIVIIIIIIDLTMVVREDYSFNKQLSVRLQFFLSRQIFNFVYIADSKVKAKSKKLDLY